MLRGNGEPSFTVPPRGMATYPSTVPASGPLSNVTFVGVFVRRPRNVTKIAPAVLSFI